MKFIVPSILFLLAISNLSCEKTNRECALLPAEIIRYDCDRVIFRLQTSEQIGDAQWEDQETGITYNNVVSYYNTCRIASLTQGAKMTLYVRVAPADPLLNDPDCIQCLGIAQRPPQTKVDFTAISVTSCEGLR